MWRAACGVQCAVCGVRCAVCGVRCAGFAMGSEQNALVVDVTVRVDFGKILPIIQRSNPPGRVTTTNHAFSST